MLGVNPADPRAVAELPRAIPADATGLYRVPALDRRSLHPDGVRTNPPGAAIAAFQRLRGVQSSVQTLEDATAAAATECDRSVRAIDATGEPPAAERRYWWTIGAWLVAAVAVVTPLGAAGLVVVASGLLVWILASLLVIGAIALVAGFALLHEAAAIQRTDASFAAAIAAARSESGDGGHPVVVVPAWNAAGVAAALRERGIVADARRVVPGPGST